MNDELTNAHLLGPLVGWVVRCSHAAEAGVCGEPPLIHCIVPDSDADIAGAHEFGWIITGQYSSIFACADHAVKLADYFPIRVQHQVRSHCGNKGSCWHDDFCRFPLTVEQSAAEVATVSDSASLQEVVA